MNYYEILKISKSATQEQIKSSYKTLVKKYHPDLYVGDKNFAETKIKEINEAYETLSNPEKKAKYDEDLTENSEPEHYYNPPSSDSSSASTTEKNTHRTDTESQWSFSEFIIEKFNKLDKKRQLQIFIMILISILALFLINLIQIKYYLSNNTYHPSSNITDDSNTYEIPDTTFDDNEVENNDLYTQNDFETLDDLFYNLLEQYETEYDDYDYNNYNF